MYTKFEKNNEENAFIRDGYICSDKVYRCKRDIVCSNGIFSKGGLVMLVNMQMIIVVAITVDIPITDWIHSELILKESLIFLRRRNLKSLMQFRNFGGVWTRALNLFGQFPSILY